jgi:hypothetical protein
LVQAEIKPDEAQKDDLFDPRLHASIVSVGRPGPG